MFTAQPLDKGSELLYFGMTHVIMKEDEVVAFADNEEHAKQIAQSMNKEKAHVVVMFEPAQKGENLTLSEQVNEVFGTFASGEEAEKWSERAVDLIKNRQWLIIPLSEINVLNLLDPQTN